MFERFIYFVDFLLQTNRINSRALIKGMTVNKIGILVLCCWAPSIVAKVISQFDKQECKFFLHLDGKRDLDAYRQQMGPTPGKHVRFIDNRVTVFWGGFTMVEAEIALAAAALADPEISQVILISDDTAPIWRPEAICDALRAYPDRITCIPNGRPRRWYEEFYFADSNFSNLRMIDMEERSFNDQDFPICLASRAASPSWEKTPAYLLLWAAMVGAIPWGAQGSARLLSK